MTAPKRTCAYCSRKMWLPDLEPCCELAEHGGRLVCTDIPGCAAVVLAQIHDGARVLAADDIRIVLDALDVAADYRRDRAEVCNDCDGHPAGELCGTCKYRLRMADEYDQLAEKIRS